MKIDYDKLYKDVHEAFTKAIALTGDSYKQLSWFARNKPKNQTYPRQIVLD